MALIDRIKAAGEQRFLRVWESHRKKFLKAREGMKEGPEKNKTMDSALQNMDSVAARHRGTIKLRQAKEKQKWLDKVKKDRAATTGPYALSKKKEE